MYILKWVILDKFKELLTEATKMDPKNPDLQYNLGVISADSGEAEKAKEYYEKVIELDPTYTKCSN